MSILINEIGDVFSLHDYINELIAPVNVETFEVTNDAKDFISKRITNENAMQLFDFIPSELLHYCGDKQLIPASASIFDKKTPIEVKKYIDKFKIPHFNSDDEIHFCFSGSWLFYFKIKDQCYSYVIQPGNALFIPANIEHWASPTSDSFAISASACSVNYQVFKAGVVYQEQIIKKSFLPDCCLFS